MLWWFVCERFAYLSEIVRVFLNNLLYRCKLKSYVEVTTMWGWKWPPCGGPYISRFFFQFFSSTLVLPALLVSHCMSPFLHGLGLLAVISTVLRPKWWVWFCLFPSCCCRCLQTLSGHVSPVTSLSFSVDGRSIISAGRDKVLHVWDFDTGKMRKTLPVFEVITVVNCLPRVDEPFLAFRL